MWVAAPIVPGTELYERAETLSHLLAAPDYELMKLSREWATKVQITDQILTGGAARIRAYLESLLSEQKIIAAHYQHVDGTSFAAPIVTSIVAQMIQANPNLTRRRSKTFWSRLRIALPHAPVLRRATEWLTLNKRLLWPGVIRISGIRSLVGPPRIENGKVLFSFTEIKRRVSRWLVSLTAGTATKTHLPKGRARNVAGGDRCHRRQDSITTSMW